MWVKVCGITRYEDARLAQELGADAIGFILTKSPRRADPEKIGGWIGEFGDIEKVGVFTTESADEIEAVATTLGLDTVQIHGELSEEHLTLKEKFKLIKAIKDLADAEGLDGVRILLDPSQGTGQVADWQISERPYILAGGLNPQNVRAAIEAARPMGIDVNSGIEQSPGIKDHNKMQSFMEAVR